MQTAIYDRDGFYLTAKESHRARIHPSSAVKGGSTWILYNELIETSGVYLRTVTQIEGKWLAEIAPFYFDVTTFPEGRMKQELMHLYQELFICDMPFHYSETVFPISTKPLHSIKRVVTSLEDHS